jgi:HlyD family secretion protein
MGKIGDFLGQIPRWILVAIAAVVIAAIVLAMVLTRAASSSDVTTQPVVQQTLVDSVTASGTVNPQNTITVGTQVSGTISELDVDFNSKVKKGEVLAKIDPSTLQDQLAQASAQQAQSEAQAQGAGAGVNVSSANSQAAAASAMAVAAAVNSASANVTKSQAALTLAQQTLTRDSTLLKQGYIAQSTVDADNSNVAQSQSALSAAQAALAQAKAQAASSSSTAQSSSAQIAQSSATQRADQAAAAAQAAVVQEDEANLQHTVITSPVDGTVISRAVSIGQTVAASLQTPTLFTIAQDLTKMEVDISVGEPDIGNVRSGDTVTFTVLAYPGQNFTGTVSQVRINPTTLNNVVTYTVIVDVVNKDGKLLPGMTANATINVASAKNALVVPLAALRAQPVRGAAAASANGGATAATGQTPWGSVNGTVGAASIAAGSNAIVMVQRGGKNVPVHVNVQLTTTTQAAVTPIAPDTLAAGDNVITGESGKTHRAGGTGRSPVSGAAGGPGGGGSTRGLRT